MPKWVLIAVVLAVVAGRFEWLREEWIRPAKRRSPQNPQNPQKN